MAPVNVDTHLQELFGVQAQKRMEGFVITYTALVIGSCIGGILRYILSVAIPTPDSFPLGILIINLVGSFVLGMFYAVADVRGIPSWLRIGFGTGVIGTFTTFSTFVVGTAQLASSMLYLSGIYAVISILGGPFMAYFGDVLVTYSIRAVKTSGEIS